MDDVTIFERVYYKDIFKRENTTACARLSVCETPTFMCIFLLRYMDNMGPTMAWES